MGSQKSGARSQNGELPPHCGGGNGPATQREQNSRYDAHNGLRFFADCAAKKWPLRGSAERESARCTSGLGSLLGGRGVFACDHSWRPLTMRVIPSLMRATLKLISSPKRLSASFK